MPSKRLKVGQVVRIADCCRAMRTCLKRNLGDGVLYGAGGCILPIGILETPATVAMLSGKSSERVCITWPDVSHRGEVYDLSMWIDVDNLTVVR